MTLPEGEPIAAVRYIVAGKKVVKLTRRINLLWYDDNGTEFALSDGISVDNVIRLGVGFFSLSEKNPLTNAARAHDFMYTSPAYQEYHTRKEADAVLYTHLRSLGANKLTAGTLWMLSRIFGGFFWENDKTR